VELFHRALAEVAGHFSVAAMAAAAA